MIAIGLALLCAVAYGSSDFFAGLASRRMHYARVGALTQAVAAGAVWLAVPFTGGTPTEQALVWGAVSGVGSGAGSVALYRGFSRGRMNVVGPLSGAGAAALPVCAGLLFGERPSALTLAGVVLVVPAIWLISTSGNGGAGRGGMVEGAVDGLVAGAGFGLLFVALSRAGHDTGLWPTAVGQLVSSAFLVAFVLAAARQVPVAGTPRQRGTAAVAGVLGAVATVAYLLAARAGLLVVVSVLAALYPAVTVLLARVVLHERNTRWQLVGLGVAAAGVVAITVG